MCGAGGHYRALSGAAQGAEGGQAPEADASSRAIRGSLAAVERRLGERCSPEQISARLRREFRMIRGMRISHETIYLSLYVQARGELRRELAALSAYRRATRRTQGAGRPSRADHQDMVTISERPPEVEDRAVPGHWEGDLLMGAEHRSPIATLVERSDPVS